MWVMPGQSCLLVQCYVQVRWAVAIEAVWPIVNVLLLRFVFFQPLNDLWLWQFYVQNWNFIIVLVRNSVYYYDGNSIIIADNHFYSKIVNIRGCLESKNYPNHTSKFHRTWPVQCTIYLYLIMCRHGTFTPYNCNRQFYGLPTLFIL